MKKKYNKHKLLAATFAAALFTLNYSPAEANDAKYFKWGQDSQGDKIIEYATNSSEADVTYNYTLNKHPDAMGKTAIKNAISTYLPTSHAKYTLSDSKETDGDMSLRIFNGINAGTKYTQYYFTPAEGEDGIAAYLAATGNQFFQEVVGDDYLFKIGETKYTINTALMPESAYTETVVSSKDQLGFYRSYFIEENAANGKLTQGLKRIDLSKTTYGAGDTSKYYKWTEDLERNLKLTSTDNPAEAKITALYNNYANHEDGHTKTATVSSNGYSTKYKSDGGAALNNASGTTSIDEVLYTNNTTNAEVGTSGNYRGWIGGAVHNAGTLTSVIADFVGNNFEATRASGGSNPDRRIYGGGALGNTGTINSLSGTFNGNFVTGEGTGPAYGGGGAIMNLVGGTISSVTADFIDNHADISAITAGSGNADAQSSGGGAIYNLAIMDNLNGDFIGNYATVSADSSNSQDANARYSGGGAVYHSKGTIGNVEGNFIANYTNVSASGSEDINAYASGGGAIYLESSDATMGNITGDFIGNYAIVSATVSGDGSVDAQQSGGGAINNNLGTMGNITGDFISNYAIVSAIAEETATEADTYFSGGGAIRNSGTIGNITGNFMSNYAISSVASAGSSVADGNVAGGGAIFNHKIIGYITADFIGNYTNVSATSSGDGTANSTISGGGAIYNGDFAEIAKITGDFIGNYANVSATSSGTEEADAGRSGGGAIFQYDGTIGDITGDFIENYSNVSALSSGSECAGAGQSGGGAIFTVSEIGNIAGKFIGNYINVSVVSSGTEDADASTSGGGAIYNEMNGEIGDIAADFIGNYSVISSTAQATATYADNTNSGGGAIFNDNEMGDISGNFIGNYTVVSAESSGSDFARDYSSGGGAIYNKYTIGDITGNFTGNHSDISATATADATYAQPQQSGGGAIFAHSGEIGDINGDFTRNYTNISAVSSGSDFAKSILSGGGAIYVHQSDIGDIQGDFTENYAIISATSNSNSDADASRAGGGAIFNCMADMSNIDGNFTGNYAIISAAASGTGLVKAYSAGGGAIYNYAGTIANIEGDFTENYAIISATSEDPANIDDSLSGGGAIYNNSEIGNITGDFTGNYATNANGNVYGGAIVNNGTITEGIINSKFIDNYATSQTSAAQGGAIYTASDLNIIADGDIGDGTTTFQGNYTQVGTADKQYEAIRVSGASNTLTLQAVNGGTINMYDYIDGSSGYTTKLTGDSDSTINLYNDINNSNVLFEAPVNINLSNEDCHDYNLLSLTLNSDMNIGIDVDLQNTNTDRINATTLTSGENNIIINAIHILTDGASKTTNVTLTSDAQFENVYKLSDDILSNITKATGVSNSYTVAYSNFGKWSDESSSGLATDKGILVFTNDSNDTLATIIQKTGDVKVYFLPDTNEEVEQNLGTLVGQSLTITGNDKEIHGNDYEGMTLGDGSSTQTVYVNDVAEFSGFSTPAITIGTNGVVNISNSVFTDNDTADISNNGTVNLTGTNSLSLITDSEGTGALGQTTIGDGTGAAESDVSTISSLVQKNVSILSDGKLSISDNLTAASGVENAGTLEFTSGTLNGAVSGEGHTDVNSTDTVTFASAVSQDVNVLAGTLDNNALITGDVDVELGAALYSTAANIDGDLTNAGTFYLEDADLMNVAGDGTTILQNNVVAADDYTIAGTLNANGKEIDMADGTNYNTLSAGVLTPASGTLKVDVDMTDSDNSDKIATTSTTTASTGTINITDINVNNATTVGSLTHQIITNANENSDLALTLGITSKTDVGTGDYSYDDAIAADTSWSDEYLHHEITDAVIDAAFSLANNDTAITTTLSWQEGTGTDTTSSLGDTLALVVQDTTNATKTFTADSDNNYTVTADLGTLGGAQLSIVGTDHTGVIDGNNKAGIAIGANTQTLELTDVSGFGGFSGAAIDNTAGGTVNISNSTVSSSIINDGESANGIFLSGTNDITSIVDSSGTAAAGQTTINGGTSTIGTLVQESLNIAGGKLIIDADNLETANDISNAGTLELTAGTLNSAVTGEGHTDVNSTGTVTFASAVSQDVNVLAGTLDNNAAITGNVLVDTNGILKSTLANAGTLTNNGEFDLEGDLGSVSGTGTTVLQNNVAVADDYTIAGTLNANGKEIDMADGTNYNTLSAGVLTPASGTLKVDVDMTDSDNSDKIATTSTTTASTGTINITDINVNNATTVGSLTHQIITNANENSDLALTLGITSKTDVGTGDYSYDDAIAADTSWSDEYLHHEITDAVIDAAFSLANDDTAITTTLTWQEGTGTDTTSSLGDTLKLVNNDTTNAVKDFTAQTSGMTYTVTDDLGVTEGTVNVNGIEGGATETVDLNGNSWFVLGEDDSVLNFNNVTVEDSTKTVATTKIAQVNKADATIGLNNAIINGKINGSEEFDMTVAGVSELNAEVTNAAIEILENAQLTTTAENVAGSSVENNSVLILSGALAQNITGDGTTKVNSTLTLNDGAEIDGTLDLNGGSVVVSSGSATTHDIGSVTGNGGFAIDFIYGDNTVTSDTINLGSDTTDYTLKLTSITETGTRLDNFTTQILTGTTGHTVLDISEITGFNSTTTEQEEVALASPIIQYNDNYGTHKWDKTTSLTVTGSAEGLLDSLTYTTTKDNYRWDPKAENLSLINAYTGEGYEDRAIQFTGIFDDTTANGTYTMAANTELGTTSAGTLTLDGVTSGNKITTVDLNGNAGFNLVNDTDLVLNNIDLKGASGNLISASNDGASVALNNSTVEGIIIKTGTNAMSLTTSGKTILKGDTTNVTLYIDGELTNEGAITADNVTAATNSKVTNIGSVTASGVLANQGNWTNSTSTSSINAATLNQYDKMLNLGSIEAVDFSTYSGSKTENQGEVTVTHALLNQGNWINGGSDSSLTAATLNQKASMLNQGAIEAVDFSTYSGSNTQNQGEVTVTHALSNEGSWTNAGTSSSLTAATLNQKNYMLNQGSIDATNITTYAGSNTQNQGEVSVTNALVNKGTWSNAISGSTLNASTLNQEGSMLNLGSIEANNMTTFAGSETENQGTVTLNNALVNKGEWTNGGASSKIIASTLNQENSMLNQGSIVVTYMTTAAGSETENQGSVKVNNTFVNKGDWTNGTADSTLNAAILNQESNMLNLGSIIATNMTTTAGSETENQGSVKVNNVLANKGDWTNGTVDSTLNAATLNQEGSMLNLGSIIATDMTTFVGSETENQGSVKVNNVLANKGDWINATADATLNAATLNQEGSIFNIGSITATDMTTFEGSETENRGTVKVNNVLVNNGEWTNSIASSKLIASTLNQKNEMLNLGSITATNLSTFTGSETENQGSVTVNNVMSNEGNWINGGTDSYLKAATLNQKSTMLNQGSVEATDFSTYSGSNTQNQGDVTVSHVLSNEGNWTNEGAGSSLTAVTLNQKSLLINQGSIETTDFSTYSDSNTQNQGSVTVTHALSNEGNWTNEGTSSSLSAATLNQKATMLNQGSIEAVDFSTYSGSNTQNQGDVTVTHVLSNEGNWTNSGTSSSLSAVTLNQKNYMLNQGSIDATNITTFVGSNTQNQGDVSVTNALVNKGNWSNSTSGSSITTSTLNQEGTMLNLGTIEANNMTTFAGSETQNQGTVTLNNALVNKGDWTNGGASSKITASTINQEATMLNQGSIVSTNMTTLAGSETENQGSIKVNNTLVNKGDWTNGGSDSSLNASTINQEATMLNQGSIVATNMTTFVGSETQNQGSVKVNDVLANKGEWTNDTSSTLNASTFNQENYFYNLGSTTATNMTTFEGSETINQSNVKVNNVLANKGDWINRTVDSVLNASTINQEATMLNQGSVTATNMTTFEGSETENRGTVKVNNLLVNKGEWTNSLATSKLTVSTLNQENEMLNLGSITATNLSTFAGSRTENQGSVKVNNVMSNAGNWINGGADSSLTASTLNQKDRMLNQGSIVATDFSTYADSRTENQGSILVNNVLSNSGNLINGTADSTIVATTLNQKDRMLNLGSVSATDMTTFADSRTENQGSVDVSNVLANKGNWINGGEDSSLSAKTLNQENKMINQGTIEATDMTTFADSSTENQGSVDVSNVLANKGNWINGGEDSSLSAKTLNQEGSMLNQGSVSATSMTTFTNSSTENQGEVSVSNVLVNKGDWSNSTTDSKITTKTLNQEGSMLNKGSITANFITTFIDSETDNQGAISVSNVLDNKGTLLNSTAGSTISAASLNQEGSMLNKGTITSNVVSTSAESDTDNQGTVNVSGSVTNRGDWTNSTAASVLTAASFSNEAGASFENSGSLGSTTRRVNNINNKSGAASFVNNATGKIYATTVVNDAPMENKSGGNITSVDFTNNNTLTNNGTIRSTSNFKNTSGASVTNNGVEGEGTLNVMNGINDSDITQGTVNIANNGVFTNNENGTMNIETSLNNSGVINNKNKINVQNSAHNAKLINAKTINSTSGIITADTLTNTNNLAALNLTNSKVAIVYQADDIKGTINVLGGNSDKTDLTITGTTPTFSGNLNVGNGSNKPVLNLLSGDVTKSAKVSIAQGSVVNVDDSESAGTSSIVIDGTDNWSGDINNKSGNVELNGKTTVLGASSTKEGGTKPYYSQTDGDLTLTGSNLTMEDSSVINGNGSIFVDRNSKFNSNTGTFTVSDLQNAGLVNGINGTYEAYVAKDNLIAGSNGDEQADFTTDLYVRSNADKKYDKYGSSTAVLSAGAGSRHGIMNISDFKVHGDMFGKDAPIDRDIMLDNIFDYGSVKAGDRIDFKATNKTVKTSLGDYRLVSRGNGRYSFSLKSFNPLVYRGQVTTLAQYQNQLAIDDMLFNHSMVNNGFKGNDYLSSHPNLYASSSDLYAPYQYSRKNGGLWVKAYGTFEKLKLTSVDADNNSYGTLIGADFGLKNLRRGWQFMPTAYIAYNGANQKWDSIDAYQNGGQLGFLGTWYKKNFMIGALAYGGLYLNDMKTPNGTDDTVGYFLGAATKTAYNWRLGRDFALQPNLFLSYNYFGKQNWNTSFGQMDMQTGMLNGINIAPGLNFIWEKETFSMYATLQYMVNISDGVTGKAGNIDLPEQKMDSVGYVQYGIGVNKQFTDRFSGFCQAVFRNLSRTGIGLQVGLNFKLGKAPQKNTSKKNTNLPKKEKTKMNVSSAKS